MTARTGSARALIVDASLLPSLLFQLFIRFKFSKSLQEINVFFITIHPTYNNFFQRYKVTKKHISAVIDT